MSSCIRMFVIFGGLATAFPASAAGDATAGQARAALCAPCHGADGHSPTDLWPNLAGQKAGYLVKQLMDFRDGSRDNPMMSPMAKQLTDEDIENLAAYFSSRE